MSNTITPELEELTDAWITYLPTISSISEKFNKPILFTEYGYLSVDNCVGKNWLIEEDLKSKNINEFCQANAIEALHTVFKGKNYWAGGFLWKWFPNGMGHEGFFEKDYTPQTKKAEKVISKIFNQTKRGRPKSILGGLLFLTIMRFSSFQYKYLEDLLNLKTGCLLLKS